MNQSRREFLGAVACAFAVANLPCTIARAAIEPESEPDGHIAIWMHGPDGKIVRRWKMEELEFINPNTIRFIYPLNIPPGYYLMAFRVGGFPPVAFTGSFAL